MLKYPSIGGSPKVNNHSNSLGQPGSLITVLFQMSASDKNCSVKHFEKVDYRKCLFERDFLNFAPLIQSKFLKNSP